MIYEIEQFPTMYNNVHLKLYNDLRIYALMFKWPTQYKSNLHVPHVKGHSINYAMHTAMYAH